MATLAPDSWAICLSVVLSKPFLAKRCSAALNILDCVTWLVLLLAAETFGIYPPSDKNLKTNWVRTFPGLHQGSQRGYLPFHRKVTKSGLNQSTKFRSYCLESYSRSKTIIPTF